jgi:hypothetical protein
MPMLYLIHQAGKVASQTLEVTICLSDRTARVERHHYLLPDNLAAVERLAALEPANPQAASLKMQAGRGLAALLVLAQTDPKDVFILSGFRDPLDFAISAFFQNLELFCPIDAEVDRVMDVFKTEFEGFLERKRGAVAPRNIRELEMRRKLQNMGEWFDNEFKPISGVDVYQIDFRADPFVCFRTQRASFLIYRMETLRANLPAIVSQLPLPEPIKISNQNLSSDKEYAALYRQFRERFKATPEMIEYYYGGRFFSHFYSGVEPLYSAERPGSRAFV